MPVHKKLEKVAILSIQKLQQQQKKTPKSMSYLARNSK
jgi:hypothetical protein